MSKRVIIGVLVLMSISLLGVVGLQLYWINDAIKVKQEQFDRSVNEALSKVVAKLETQEAVTVVTDQMASLHKPTDSLYHAEPQQTAPAAQTKKNLNASATANVPSVTAAPAGPAATVPPHTESSAQAAQPKYRAAQAVATAQRQGSAGDFVFYFSKADSSRIKQVLRNISGTSTTIVPSLTRGAEGYQRIVNAQVDSLTVARLRKGGILQLEQVTDTTHKRFLRINNRPVRISADTLRSMALQLDSLRQHVKFTSVFSPTEIASVDVRNDSVFIVRKGKKDPVLISSGNHAGAITLMGSRTPSPVLNRKDTVPHRIAVSQKVATALTATVSPSTEGAAQAGKATKVPPPKKIKPSDIKKIDIRKDKLNDVVQKMVVEYVVKDVPLQKRMNLQHLPELIKAELQQQGIDLNFGYWVVAGDKDTVAARNLLPLKKQAVTAYKANLFPNDIFDKQDHLGLYFPDSKIYAFKSLGGMLALSALFTLVIIATFGSTIHIIYKQKKLSEMKNDFINNMTHEFKTPIATISLASDAIANPKVYQNPEKVQYYTNIIRQENKRMNAQVENVLQIALLEKNDYKLNFRTVDVHALIERAIDSIRLQVEERLGKISVQLNAMQHQLRSDEVHLFNVICNLLDNANKYSPAAPEIRLVTQNVEGGLVIAVEDKGVGMSKDTQQRVFEKFYRVPTGNLHNVKGFGLGLSYVKAIVQAHQGQVRLKSEPGKGSRFEIFLPLQEPR